MAPHSVTPLRDLGKSTQIAKCLSQQGREQKMYNSSLYSGGTCFLIAYPTPAPGPTFEVSLVSEPSCPPIPVNHVVPSSAPEPAEPAPRSVVQVSSEVTSRL